MLSLVTPNPDGELNPGGLGQQSRTRIDVIRCAIIRRLLPGADGIELMKTLPELANIPVIFISAYGRDETIARAPG